MTNEQSMTTKRKTAIHISEPRANRFFLKLKREGRQWLSELSVDELGELRDMCTDVLRAEDRGEATLAEFDERLTKVVDAAVANALAKQREADIRAEAERNQAWWEWYMTTLNAWPQRPGVHPLVVQPARHDTRPVGSY